MGGGWGTQEGTAWGSGGTRGGALSWLPPLGWRSLEKPPGIKGPGSPLNLLPVTLLVERSGSVLGCDSAPSFRVPVRVLRTLRSAQERKSFFSRFWKFCLCCNQPGPHRQQHFRGRSMVLAGRSREGQGRCESRSRHSLVSHPAPVLESLEGLRGGIRTQ